MNIAIVGYGKMGQAVERWAIARGHTVSAIIDRKEKKAAHAQLSTESLAGSDVAIDFTAPATAVDNIRTYGANKVNAVIGTTGWYEALPEVESIVRASDIGLLYAGNFSIGVNLFYAIVAAASQKISTAGGFDVGINEIHHTGKADAPSGTAREISQTVLANFPAKKRVLLDNAEQPVPTDALQVTSQRIGSTIGVHTVTFDGVSDTITLTHTGKNRDGYASGAVIGAEWLANKKGIFTVKEWLALA